MEHERLIKEIEDYCNAIGRAPSSFCLEVVSDGTLYKRITNGGDCGVKKLDRIRAYIRENPPEAREADSDVVDLKEAS
ncbi:MAG: hypothetical protein ACRBBO_15355 [Cognatishimia sp.]